MHVCESEKIQVNLFRAKAPDTDVENGSLDIELGKVGEGGMNKESSNNMHMLPWWK